MTASPQPIRLHPPFKVPSPLRSSGRCLLTSRGFQVASQSFKKLCLTTFTMACVKRRPEFGVLIWKEREVRGLITMLQSFGACLARSYTWDLQEGSPKRSM